MCKVCLLFGAETVGKGSHQRVGVLVKQPFRRWKDAKEIFRNHQKLEYHKTSSLRADEFLSVAEKRRDDVATQVDEDRKKQIYENRARLCSIVDSLMLCGRQGISLRGTDDAGPVGLEDPTHNDGNFRALLRFRARSGDTELANQLTQAAGSRTQYTSPTIQNELLQICGEEIQKKIVSRVNENTCFTLLADECQSYLTEHLAIAVRYVDSDLQVREDFLTYVPVTTVTASALTTTLITTITELGLDPLKMVGQGYDGAPVMKGHLSGVQTQIREKYPMATYVHCASHSLNLAISDSSSVTQIRNCMGTVQKLASFFRDSILRSECLGEILKSEMPQLEFSNLLKLCNTRWVERQEAVKRVKIMYVPIVLALEKLETSGKNDTPSLAYQLRSAITQPEFLMSLLIMDKMFSLTKPLSEKMQKVDIDLVECCEHASLLISTFQSLRSEAETEFKSIYEECESLMEIFDFKITTPRTTKRQTHRVNVPADAPEEYYRRAIFNPYLDHFITSLQDRFGDQMKTARHLQCCLPAHCHAVQQSDIEEYASVYSSLLPDPSTLTDEFVVWKNKWSSVPPKDKPKSPLRALESCNKDFFPNIHALLLIFATLPVTTATVERSFSTLRRLKTYLRSTMGEERLTHLALLNVYRNDKPDPLHVVDVFAKKLARRLELIL